MLVGCLALIAVAGCAQGETACAAIGYGSALTVRLEDAWPDGPARSVDVDCGDGCSYGPPAVVDADGVAVVSLVYPPIPFTVRVLEGDVVVAQESVSPDFVRVDGTEECGGNTEAEVVVPAP